MKSIFKHIVILTAIITVAACSTSSRVTVKNKNAKAPTKKIAFTFDDLPFAVNNEFISEDEKMKLFSRTLKVLKKHNIKATGFVIGGKYNESWYPYIKEFLRAGHTLGNHTFSHLDLNETSAEVYIENISACEKLLESLVEKTEKQLNLPFDFDQLASATLNGSVKAEFIYPSPNLTDKEKIASILTAAKEEIEKIRKNSFKREHRYFRYPYLNRGDTEQKKYTVLSALERMGYQVTPVTITSNDWRFNPRYETAYLNNRTEEMEELSKKYLARIKRELFNTEDYSEVTFHRQVKQIMLFHMNVINSMNLEKIIRLLIENGYEFVDIDEALTDEIYDMADGYKGSYGVPWLYRAKKIRSGQNGIPVK